MATVTFKDASLTYPGAKEPTVKKFNLEIADGEFLVLVGPSGCGKSTTLRMLAGLENVTDGAIFIGDKDVTHVAPRDRDIAMVFQNYALYPHMTVRENMGFALKIAGKSQDEINKRVDEAAATLGLTEFLERKPKALSGGQRQRVAMGRAIVRNPQVFLMDEPLSNLDAKLRVQTRTQIAALQRKLGVTTVYVTHDQTEALTMGDRIAVLKDGYLQQVGAPRELYDRPAKVFVAGFIGSPAMNLGTFTVKDGDATSGHARIKLSPETIAAMTPEDNDRITIGFRPEALEIIPEGESTDHSIPIKLDFVEELGSDSFLYGKLVGEGDLGSSSEDVPESGQIVVRSAPNTAPAPGSVFYARIVEGGQHNFSASTGKRLP